MQRIHKAVFPFSLDGSKLGGMDKTRRALACCSLFLQTLRLVVYKTLPAIKTQMPAAQKKVWTKKLKLTVSDYQLPEMRHYAGAQDKTRPKQKRCRLVCLSVKDVQKMPAVTCARREKPLIPKTIANDPSKNPVLLQRRFQPHYCFVFLSFFILRYGQISCKKFAPIFFLNVFSFLFALCT